MYDPETESSKTAVKSITPVPPLPSPPSPSADTGILPDSSQQPHNPLSLVAPDTLDVFVLKPLTALKMLCDCIEHLVRITGDVPPTPPILQPSMLQRGPIELQDSNIASISRDVGRKPLSPETVDDNGVPARVKTPIGSPEAHPAEPLHIIGANKEPLNFQHGAIARKFYSKKPPPISLEEYLLRLHKFCPMSTAVYLATSLHIHRLAVVEKTIPLTARNIHRLVLAGLRITMKALEDQSYPHRRFAKVGGVSEAELGRLEVSFCFITNFELKVNKKTLSEHIETIRDVKRIYAARGGLQAKMPLTIETRTIPLEQTESRAHDAAEALTSATAS